MFDVQQLPVELNRTVLYSVPAVLRERVSEGAERGRCAAEDEEPGQAARPVRAQLATVQPGDAQAGHKRGVAERGAGENLRRRVRRRDTQNKETHLPKHRHGSHRLAQEHRRQN